jgi:hypothetical protein
MRTRYFPSNCYRLVPVQSAEKREKPEWMRIITELANMNKGFIEKGAGRKVVNRSTGEQEYRDVPQFSLKLHKRDGKIHTYVNIPKDREQVVKTKFEQALYSDIGEYRIEEDPMELPETNLHAFSIKGSHHLAIDLDGNPKIKELFRSVDNMMYSLTVKEVEDHEAQRDQFEKARLGLTSKKAWAWHYTKTGAVAAAKMLYDFWYDGEEETKKKHLVAWQQIKKLLPKKEQQQPYTERKLSSEKNRFMLVEALFLLWTDDEEKAKQFHSNLQKLMTEMQGENRLEVVQVEPDLEKVVKGRIHYTLPTLCLYQTELSKFLLLPDTEDKDFHFETPEKTTIPVYALNYEVGALALGRKINTQEVIAMPITKNETDLDDRGTPTLISGKKGSGKTQLIINQVADTFCFGASSMEEWKEKARSVILMDVADGSMLREVYELVPEEMRPRVVFINHADLENPIPITNHDILNINQVDGFAEEIANMETEMLMDSLKDRNSTVAIERYFKMALQASYLVGEGNIIDAMRIIEDRKYRGHIIDLLTKRDDNVFLPGELRKMDDVFEDAKALETIDNRISRLKNTQPWIDCVSQSPTEGLDFWRWINGDENGAYLVLIYIPKRINKSFRSFLFAHYFMKIWYMTEAREILNESERKEFLVIVDELHQIFGHRVVPIVLEQIYKEARKYRARFVFTIHGWSSIKDKETKDVIRDGSGNYIMLKGGSDMFTSLKDEFEPYTIEDFNELMKLNYCGIFKIDIKKKTHVFQAKLMEPAAVRFKKHRKISLEKFRSIKNSYGRPKKQVRAFMRKGGEKACQQEIKSLESELAEITGGNAW